MPAANFHAYFPVPARERAWGLHASACGIHRVPPGAAYPPGGHPENHLFSWERGRVLSEYQLLYIREGGGLFESGGQRRRLAAGTAFVLFPGVRHRYRPDPATGWTEMWIEMGGPWFDALRAGGLLDPARPVHRLRPGARTEIEALWEEALRLARTRPPGHAVRLGLVAAQLAAAILLTKRGGTRAAGKGRETGFVAHARTLLEGEKEIAPAAAAKKLGISYSYFRREFKRQTGFSPKQYRIEVRHRRARDLLRGSGLAVKE
ncbi:MAG TPA: AraC family transcriptional regulator, partial [Candidatus Methylacidiphilales bacterium]